MTFSEILHITLFPILFLTVYRLAPFIVDDEYIQYAISVLIAYVTTAIILKYF